MTLGRLINPAGETLQLLNLPREISKAIVLSAAKLVALGSEANLDCRWKEGSFRRQCNSKAMIRQVSFLARLSFVLHAQDAISSLSC